MQPAYLQALREGITLVTPTRRLAALIADRYAVEMRDEGTWEAPPVIPLAGWLADVHARLLERLDDVGPGLLLSADQELALWEQAVAQSANQTVLSADTLARLAADAWTTKTYWELPPMTDERYGHRAEVRAFRRWCERFERRCDELRAIDHARFARELTVADAALTGALPAFRFFGFARLPPLLLRIATRCSAGGAYGLESSGNGLDLADTRAYPHAEGEIAAAMQWAREAKTANPTAAVSVAMAGGRRLAPATRVRLRRAFSRTPDNPPGAPVPSLDYPPSGALADEPVIASALLLLDERRTRPWQEISRLLLSPYVGGAAHEQAARARLDRELRRNGDTETTWQAVIALASHQDYACPELVSRLEAIAKARQTPHRRTRLHDWMAYAESILSAAGWPGDDEPGEAEQAVILDWSRVMDSVAALDAVMPPCSFAAAFGKWRSMLRRRQPAASVTFNAINIVTVEEAAFLQPECLWIAGLNDTAWPPPGESNPLLPLTLLRDEGVPGGDPARELHHAETVLEQFGQRAGRLVFSYAASEADTPRRPFSKLRDPQSFSETFASWPRSASAFEHIDDMATGPLAAGRELRGGVSLFTDLAACPFRAVALHRLHAGAPEDPTSGLNALQRGTLVHAVMATFWEEMGSSERLAQSDASTIGALLRRAAARAITTARRRYRLPDPFWSLEQQRLVAIGREWLHHEQARGEFDVVACEQAAVAEVGGHALNTRIDRIDRLKDGSLLIIDYKSGKVTPRDWDPPRPDQPQLPLYATATAAGDVAGIAYGQIRQGECRLVDFPVKCAGRDGVSDEQREQWTARCGEWAAALGELAIELDRGHALADPKRDAETCRYCELQALCRIDEAHTFNIESEPASGD